ncbi:hypothetical protein BASA81_011270 [Batrachochytrium salamandrivorans]|nr:hypothetical protein BASA81_011270 [Batrachochytrium salamandrivorans]
MLWRTVTSPPHFAINTMAAIPPWAMSLIESLSDEQQTLLITTAGKAMMDPWFVPTATIPAAYVLAYVPHFVKVAVFTPLLMSKYNNVTPRYTNWDEQPIPKWASELIKRLASAHENGLEAMVGFAPAVLMCRMNKVKDVAEVRRLCMRFLALRFLFSVAYALGEWKAVSVVRTLVWGAGFSTTLQLYSLAVLG